jgi:hypothetical protein
LTPEDISPEGKLVIALRASREPTRDGEPWRTFVEVVAALDRDCAVRVTQHHPDGRIYLCSTCDQPLPDRDTAVVHQLGSRVVDLLTSIHGFDDPEVRPLVLGQLTAAAADRNRARWHWLLDEL